MRRITSEHLPERLLHEIRTLAQRHDINRVLLFGSRARGDHRRTSDIDLAASGGNIPAFSIDLEEETSTLLRFDCVDLDAPLRPELRAAIEEEGRLVYEKA